MMTAPAGWYPDPENASQSRWWNGVQWSDHRAPLQQAVATPYSVQSTNLTAPEGTAWNTQWIWLIVILPYIPMLGFFTIDWSRFFDISDPSGMSSLSIMLSPGYLFAVLGGWAALGLLVWFSYLDWSELKRRGVPKPFHWAFGFLTMVYPIGRSVVVRRRTGHGISPMWVTIILYVALVISMLVFVTVMMTSLFTTISESSLYYGA